jgi:integrase
MTPHEAEQAADLYHRLAAIGELLGLKWRDIDLKAGEVHVLENLTAPNGVMHTGTPKSGKGRTISIDTGVVRALRTHRAEQRARHLHLGAGWTEQTYVISSAVATPVHPFNATAAFRRILVKHPELPRIRFHDLRHTCATLLLKRGVNVKVVSEMLGHADVSITLRVYAHVIPGMSRDASRTMGSMLFDLELADVDEGDGE